ncbi:hypothetical protein JQ582_42110 [Bradyrhizobium japonicum]|uniref:hypothetical protein n=1 Tax=Bradyrhizobium japonicum TaxID=375 RepID=UPI001BAA5028|nr:hypothetical protein [Bradyrhizobium japonicum]MBR0750493.1 hypothetical protein [Bradyrhizobium japonicum]
MSKTDLAERLSQMVDAADRDGAAQQAAIVRRHAADGMLQSGNFFVAENDALNAIYESALHAMVDHALSVTAPSVVASAVKTSGLELESKFLGRFEGILGGSASGNASADAPGLPRAFERKAESSCQRRRKQRCWKTCPRMAGVDYSVWLERHQHRDCASGALLVLDKEVSHQALASPAHSTARNRRIRDHDVRI